MRLPKLPKPSMDILYEDPDWKVVRETASLPNEIIKDVTRVHAADRVHLVAFITDTTIAVLREYRPFYGEWVYMLPGGRVDKETDHLIAAQRELQEEAGYKADLLELFGESKNTESTTTTNYYYRARNLTEDPLPEDDDELMEVHEMTIDEALEKILGSPVVHTPSAYALFLHKRISS